jgi:hypothetical protein
MLPLCRYCQGYCTGQPTTEQRLVAAFNAAG